MANFWDAQRANTVKSYALMAAVAVMVVAIALFAGWMLEGGAWVAPLALGLAAVYSIGGYFWGDKVVLAASGARPADEREHAYLLNTVEGLALAAGLPKPKLYVIDDPSPNAFATGRDPAHASIAVTTGLMERMNRAELEGVLGHEMSHIRNLDMRFMTLTIVLVGMVAILSDITGRMMMYGGGRRDERGNGSGALIVIGLLLMILGPLAAQMVRMAISRQREYLADASAAQLTRNPDGLAAALEKLKSAPPMRRANDATAPLFISDPVSGGKPNLSQKLMGLFSTHPPLEERIKRLREM